MWTRLISSLILITTSSWLVRPAWGTSAFTLDSKGRTFRTLFDLSNRFELGGAYQPFATTGSGRSSSSHGE